MKFALAASTGVSILLLALPLALHAQTASVNQLRSTIKSQIMSDPRSQNLSQTQVYSMVNALTLQAQDQGLTTSQLTYRPTAPGEPVSTFSTCDDVSCSLSQAFGLDGSIPLIPIALIVLAVLFIAIYSLMREMGHPHAQA